jgi:hypothetical protein
MYQCTDSIGGSSELNFCIEVPYTTYTSTKKEFFKIQRFVNKFCNIVSCFVNSSLKVIKRDYQKSSIFVRYNFQFT